VERSKVVDAVVQGDVRKEAQHISWNMKETLRLAEQVVELVVVVGDLLIVVLVNNGYIWTRTRNMHVMSLFN